MSKRPFVFGACYYCICTACSGKLCPFAHREFKSCTLCQEHRVNSPRLDCDFFQHYIKIKSFKFQRASLPRPVNSGTYVLFTSRSVFVGKYENLEPLRKRFGGTLRQISFLDFIGGLDHDKS